MADSRTRSNSGNSRDSQSPEVFMRRALELSLLGRCSAPPNPWVGCVIVKNGEIISEGWHRRRGERHAEANAFHTLPIEASGGADLYVTLEPCSHYGLTPPCCEQIAARGIRAVYVGVLDPDTRVSGRGMNYLLSKGIKVFSGILESEIRQSLRPYIHHRVTGRPFVVGKIACSLNGSVACLDGTSQWITGPEARADSHRLRKESQAVLVGVNTVLADDPELTHRLPASECRPQTVDNDKQPLRVVIDPQGRSLGKPSLKLFDQTKAKTLFIVKGENGSMNTGEAEVLYTEKIDLDEILKILADRGILQLFVEGGAITLSQFLAKNLVNEFVVYQAPKFFQGRNFLETSIPATIADVEAWKIQDFSKIGTDVKLVLTPRSSPF